MLSFKLFGIVLIMISSTLFGFYKAQRLAKRKKRLSYIINALSCLSEQIKFGGGELKTILPSCFSGLKEFPFFDDNPTLFDDITDEDNEILRELFSNIGSGDSSAECDRIARAISQLGRKYAEATEEAEQKSKIWQCGGVSVGLAISILLM